MTKKSILKLRKILESERGVKIIKNNTDLLFYNPGTKKEGILVKKEDLVNIVMLGLDFTINAKYIIGGLMKQGALAEQFGIETDIF